jgi:hypothetical protein
VLLQSTEKRDAPYSTSTTLHLVRLFLLHQIRYSNIVSSNEWKPCKELRLLSVWTDVMFIFDGSMSTTELLFIS